MTNRSIITLDLETSIKNRGDESVGSFPAAPHHPLNKIVLTGIKPLRGKCLTLRSSPTLAQVECGMMIGHNIKFDLLYLFKEVAGFREQLPYIKIWDTMVVEYLLSGQSVSLPSLDYCAEKYGGELKPDTIKEYWQAGIDTEDIPHEELASYLRGDLNNTEIVYLAQLEQAKELGMLPLIKTQMDALRGVAEMEWNGMHFNKVGALAASVPMIEEVNIIRKECLDIMQQKSKHFSNPTSSKQLSVYLFGGSFKVKLPEIIVDDNGDPVIYKSGKKKGEVKTRLTETTIKIKGECLPQEKWRNKIGYTTDDSVMKILDTDFTRVILKVRELEKHISTYYVGLSDLVWQDGCVHGNLNQAITNTGRLSSSAPNMQNVSGKEG